MGTNGKHTLGQSVHRVRHGNSCATGLPKDSLRIEDQLRDSRTKEKNEEISRLKLNTPFSHYGIAIAAVNAEPAPIDSNGALNLRDMRRNSIR